MARLLPAKWVWWYRTSAVRWATPSGQNTRNGIKRWHPHADLRELRVEEDDGTLTANFKIDKDGRGRRPGESVDHLDLKRNRFAKRVFAIFDVDGSNETPPGVVVPCGSTARWDGRSSSCRRPV